MKSKILIVVFLLIIMISCSDSPIESSSYSTIDGTIFYNGEPVENALVRLSNSSRYNVTITTSTSGSFEFQSVPDGSYRLTSTKTLENGSFIEKSDEISVEGDCSFENLILPDPVIMYEAINISNESITISWSPTNALDFREYKLYRGFTSGLDETTGLLVHVSTAFNDTIFTNDDLNTFETYYYRIYVMNDYGRMGGSNIISATTMNQDIIDNGGFEELYEDEPINWTLIENSSGNPENYIVIDTTDPFEGINSLQFGHSEVDGCWEQWITQSIDIDVLVPGAEYLLTFSYKSNFSRNTYWDLILRNTEIDLWFVKDIDYYNDNLWRQYECEFSLPNDIGNNNINMSIHFCNEGIVQWWIDDVMIVRLD